jgi:hypothetical protein
MTFGRGRQSRQEEVNGMRFAVESWDPAYGISADSESLEPAREPVDDGVELAPADWRPLDPPPVASPPPVLFVDGVRRIDIRVWITDGELARPGLCATVAAGAVRCQPHLATVVSVIVERGLYTPAAGAEPIVTPSGGTYQLREVAGDDDAALYFGVHNHMTELENRVSRAATGGEGPGPAPGELVVFDGPLRGRESAAGTGYIKTQHVQYLEPAQQRIVAGLAPGQRSPLFAIGGRFPRWSWYLRLPGRISHPFSGIVRLELAALGDAVSAADRADLLSAVLPRFASEPHKEPRAPQNLHPIAGLERELRRRLGDDHLLQRSLRAVSMTAA